MFRGTARFASLKPELDDAIEDDLEGDLEKSHEEEWNQGRKHGPDQILQRERQVPYFINIRRNGEIISSRREIRRAEQLVFRTTICSQPLRLKLVSETSCERAGFLCDY